MSRVFLSHAGTDHRIAESVAASLRTRGMEPLLDREELRAGDSFIAFMEEALSTSDYCLLLWSASAATRKWVREEWQAALHRSVEEARGFLLVGRLDAHPMPTLLAPRVYVTLHPELEPGLSQVVAMWQDDQLASTASERPVAGIPAAAGDKGDLVYVTSELFGVTVPCGVDLDAPVAVTIESLRERLGFPSSMDYKGRVGVRFEYTLAFGEIGLRRAKSLRTQGVRAKDLLWLQSAAELYSATQPADGRSEKVIFRGTARAPGEPVGNRNGDLRVMGPEGDAALGAAALELTRCVERARLGR